MHASWCQAIKPFRTDELIRTFAAISFQYSHRTVLHQRLSVISCPSDADRHKKRSDNALFRQCHYVKQTFLTTPIEPQGGSSHTVELACAGCYWLCMQRGEEAEHIAVNVLSVPDDEEGTITTTGSPSSSQELPDAVSGAENDSSVLLPSQGVFNSDSEPAARRTPWFAWPLLLASLASVSSAGVIFGSLP